ncbi:hypothetical protein SDC9_168101 [bioreactor metagenome]|uniref:Uncharacterized protein n=1 Tax=bioreactor metagenome TaxID=1076179 RepID=A0A645G450_9ZZZZ
MLQNGAGQLVVIEKYRERRFPEVGHHRNRAAKGFRLFRADLRKQVDDAVHQPGGEVAKHLLPLLMTQSGQGDDWFVREFLQLFRQAIEEGGGARIAALVDHHADQPGRVVLQRLRIETRPVIQLPDFVEDALLDRGADDPFAADGV